MGATTTRTHNPSSIMRYWSMVKDMDDSQKLELVTMLIDSIRMHREAINTDAHDRERGFRSLAGCWANDHDDDDIETIIRKGRENREGNRLIPPFDE